VLCEIPWRRFVSFRRISSPNSKIPDVLLRPLAAPYARLPVRDVRPSTPGPVPICARKLPGKVSLAQGGSVGNRHLPTALSCTQDIAPADANVASGEHRRSAGSWVAEVFIPSEKGVHGLAWSCLRRSFVILANLAHTYGKTLGHPEAINVVWKYTLQTIAPLNRNKG